MVATLRHLDERRSRCLTHARRAALLPRHAHIDEALVKVHAFVSLYRRLG
ncbi:hypothetical protein ACWGH3_26790 [Streptomyces sp. NPDC054884]|nr:hypothetical protein [Streptomyces sp. ME08-AFT2]MDX3311480.1 hypothetical protein [Streptomyces sp. ME08-AFT2]